MTQMDPAKFKAARRGGPRSLVRTIVGDALGPSVRAEWAVVVVSLVFAAFLLVDPIVLQTVRLYDDGTRSFFRSFTDLGKSGWILIPTGAAAIALYAYRRQEYRLRRTAAVGLATQIFAFVFVAVGGTSLASSLIKNILGRARPKFFESMGPIEFRPFAFDYDFASFPSGHATTICALGATLAILWPRARFFLMAAAVWIAATRFLIGSHFLSDVIGGVLLGFWGPYLLRDRLAVRRWLFERRGETIKLRGARLRRWLAAEARMRLLPGSDTVAQSG